MSAEKNRALTAAQNSGLTAEQFRVASYFAMPKSARPPITDIAAEVGVTEPTLYNWLKLPEVDEVRRQLARAYFVSFVPDVVESMKNRALLGDVPAAQLFLKWAREVDQDDVKNVNVRITVAREEVEAKIAELRRKTQPVDAEVAPPPNQA